MKTQPRGLVRMIAKEMGIQEKDIVNWELEVFDTQPAQLGGLEKEFIFAGRIDDKLCAYAAIEGLLASETVEKGDERKSTAAIRLVGLFDDEEVGSLTRQGARSNFLPETMERIVEGLSGEGKGGRDLMAQCYANSFLLSADVTHAVNPNFEDVYLEGHEPKLNVGVTVAADSNAHMTTGELEDVPFVVEGDCAKQN